MSNMNTLIADLEAIPLADMTERDQLTFAAAIGQLRRFSDRVHTLEISQHRADARIEALEEALGEISDSHVPDQPMADDCDEATYVRKHHMLLRNIAYAALKAAQ